MRCVLVGVYFVVAMAMTVPTCFGDDAAIARKVAEKLRFHQEQQALKGFHITVKVEEGTVWMLGDVANADQRDMALDTARRIEGVKLVVNDLDVANHGKMTAESERQTKSARETAGFVDDPTSVRQATAVAQVPMSRGQLIPQAPSAPVGIGLAQYAAPPTAARAPMHVARMAGCGAGGVNYGAGVPVAEYGGAEYGGYVNEGVVYEGGGGGISSGQPQMPGHAWPSYASYPNYGAVTYPKQYSPKAWPYIGPFYPYPQVPLGWRKVALEWDDGWWMLDFSSK